jgi:23S rRNA (guanosine2251-2'-O)-methyltransferase
MAKLSMVELGRADVASFKEKDKNPIIAILDNVRSALNVGSVFRTSDAFAIESISLCGITATPPNREITKTAIGATESVDWAYFEDTLLAIEAYRNKGYKIYAVEQTDDSTSLMEINFDDQKIAVVFGNEVDGVSDEVLKMVDGCIEIPQFGTKHSLNVSVCAGIILWELTKGRTH